DVFAHHRRGLPMDRWARMVRESFDQLYEDGASSGRLLVLGVHPWLMGQPFRVGHLKEVLRHISSHENVWFATGSEVVDWYLEQQGAEQTADPVRQAASR